MVNKIVFAIVLCLRLSGVISFYIAKVNNQPAVYEVKEDKTTHTLTIINPTAEKPTLREIIYYHIIEKPYEQVIKQYNSNNDHNKVNYYVTEEYNSIIEDGHNINGEDDLIYNNNLMEREKNSDYKNNSDVNNDPHTNNKEFIIIVNDDTVTDNIFESNDNNLHSKRYLLENTNKRKEQNINSFNNDTEGDISSGVSTPAPFDRDVKFNDSKNISASNGNLNESAGVNNRDLNEKTPEDVEKIIEYTTSPTQNIAHRNASKNTHDTMYSTDKETSKYTRQSHNHSSDQETETVIENTSEDLEHNILDNDKQNLIDNQVNSTYNSASNRKHFIGQNKFSNKTTSENEQTYIDVTKTDISNTKNKNKITKDSKNLPENNTIVDNIMENNFTGKDYNDFEHNILYVDNDYENPYDGKEGVDFQARQFTNGHGFQYFYPKPNDQLQENIELANLISNNNHSKVESYEIEESKVLEDIKIRIDDKITQAVAVDSDPIEITDNKRITNIIKPSEEVTKDEPKITESNTNNSTKIIEKTGHNEEKPEILLEKLESIKPVEDNDYDIIINKDSEEEPSLLVIPAENEHFKETDLDKETQDKIRTKRKIRTLMSIIEDIAPEDKYKDVMDKISERVKRSLKQDGNTYGMTLTGGRGVVWNDFDDGKVTFPVGVNSGGYESLPKTKTSEESKRNEPTENTYDNNLQTDLIQVLRSEKPHVAEFNIVKTNKGEYRELIFLKAKTNDLINDNNIKDIHKNDLNRHYETFPSVKETVIENGSIGKVDEEKNNKQSTREITFEKPIKTYGMSLIGGRGKVWNDFNERQVSHQVGKSTKDSDSSGNKFSKDDEEINEKIEAFQRFLDGVPLDESKIENPSTEKLIVNKPKNKAKKVKSVTSKSRKTEKLEIVESRYEIPELNETRTESKVVEERKEDDRSATYGMSLSGDNGVVWNDLNGDRLIYHTGNDYNEDVTPALKITEDNKVINDKIKEFQKFLNDEGKTDETIDKVSNTDKPVIIEPLTEEPIISEPTWEDPKTNRPIVIGPTTKRPEPIEFTTEELSTESPDKPVKTYGMSLTGDHGLVWNDLNGDRVSYHVGEEIDSMNDEVTDTTLQTYKPYEDNKDPDTEHLLNEIDVVIDEIDTILEEMAEETYNPSNHEEEKEILNEIIDIIKEVFANETAKLEEKFNLLNNSTENIFGNAEHDENESPRENFDIQKIVDNEDFQNWLHNRLSSYTDFLVKRVDKQIKEEVAKQIEEYLRNETETENNNYNNDEEPEIAENKEDVEDDEEIIKKRKDCDDKNGKKESAIKIAASNIYGNSVKNGNVTNIFIFNINQLSDLNNITMKPLNNGTNGIYSFENENKPLLEDNKGDDKSEGLDTSFEEQPIEKPTEAITNLPDSHDFEDKTNEKETEKPNKGNPVHVVENSEESIESKKEDSDEIIDNGSDNNIENLNASTTELLEETFEEKIKETELNPNINTESNSYELSDGQNEIKESENDIKSSEIYEDKTGNEEDKSIDHSNETGGDSKENESANSTEQGSSEHKAKEDNLEEENSVPKEVTANSSENKKTEEINDKEDNDSNSEADNVGDDKSQELSEENKIEGDESTEISEQEIYSSESEENME